MPSFPSKEIDEQGDYVIYKENNPDANEMQMDTVEGIKENNAPVIGAKKIDGFWYYFDKTGRKTVSSFVDISR